MMTNELPVAPCLKKALYSVIVSLSTKDIVCLFQTHYYFNKYLSFRRKELKWIYDGSNDGMTTLHYFFPTRQATAKLCAPFSFG